MARVTLHVLQSEGEHTSEEKVSDTTTRHVRPNIKTTPTAPAKRTANVNRSRFISREIDREEEKERVCVCEIGRKREREREREKDICKQKVKRNTE